MLYKGLRAIISLMPEALENNRIVNGMGLDQNDDALVDFSKAFITAKQPELEIKYPNLQPILFLFDKDPRTGDRYHLDAFFQICSRRKPGLQLTQFFTCITRTNRMSSQSLKNSGKKIS